MRVTDSKMKFTRLCLVTILCVTIVPGRVFADDGTPSGTASPIKMDAPKPGLTEREQYLLDRVEQLERRVEELESKGGQPAAPAPSVSQPGTPGTKDAANSAATPGAIAATPATAAPVNTISSSNSSLSNPAIGPQAGQATEKGKSGGTATGKAAKEEPFAFADFTWLNGNSRTKDTPYATTFFTPEIRADVDYNYSFNHPADDTIGGSSEVFRSNELHVTQLGVGGDFHLDNVRARVMTQFGLYSQTTPGTTPARHVGNGIWTTPTVICRKRTADITSMLSTESTSMPVSSCLISASSVTTNSTIGPISLPMFLPTLRGFSPVFEFRSFPTAHLKIEPWLVNGWQSYGRFNNRPGVGAQILWRPNGWLSVLGNQYALGEEALGNPNRVRYHSDDSIEVKYFDKPGPGLDKMAFSLTGDIGCEHGGGVSCAGGSKKGPKQSFLGFMFYNRFWFDRDHFGLTVGGGKINNPGRYLVLLPPINGATAASGTSYFTENPGDVFKAWDMSGTFDWMPSQYITFRSEFDHRAANVPYFTGPGGITPTSCPTAPIVENICGSPGAFVPGFTPDLKKIENRINLSILVKF